MLLLSISLIVLLGISIIIVVRTALTDKLDAVLQQKGVVEAKHMAEKVARQMLHGNSVVIKMMISDAMRLDKEIEYVYVHDRAGTVIAHTFDEGFPVELLHVGDLEMEASHHVVRLNTDEGLITNINVPILDGIGGFLTIGFSEKYVHEEVRSLVMMITWIVFGVLSIGIFGTYIFSRRIMKPLADLTSSAREVGRRGLARFSVAHTHDEIEELGNALNNMTEDLSRTLVSRDYLDSVLESMGDSVVVVDREHNIKSVNVATLHLLGFSKEELVGRPFSAILEEDSDPVYRECIDDELSMAGRFDNHETFYKTKNGKSIPVMMSASQIKRDGSSIDNIVFGAKDIRERKRIEADLLSEKLKTEQKVQERTSELKATVELLKDEIESRRAAELAMKKAKDAAVSASNAKSEFLANMSHEIRTPMNGVIGMTELALKADDPEKREKFLLTVKKSASTLLRLINDILDFSKIEAGKMEMENVEFDINKVIENVMALTETDKGCKNVSMRYYSDSDMAPWLKGDPYRLQQVVTNLLSNALKFTEEGQIEVRVASRYIDEERGDVLVHVSVSDTGIGIEEDKLNDIFKSFTQADGSSTRKYGGTGLGLAISRKIVSEMHGDIWAESVLGRGSVFHFTAKLQESDGSHHGRRAEFNATPEESEMSVETGGIRVLLAEDNMVNQEVGALMMQEEGYRVDVANNGREAIELLQKKPFDVILMDMQMPELDGVSATKIIRDGAEAGFNPDIPIIALTAHAFKENREKCMASGMNGFVSKPFKIEDINREIYKVFETAGMHSDDGGINTPVLDREDMLKRVGGREQVVVKVWKVFRRDVPVQLETLKRALTQENDELMQRQAHSLKSAAANVGAKTMSSKALELEKAIKAGRMDNIHQIFEGLEHEFARVVDELDVHLEQN